MDGGLLLARRQAAPDLGFVGEVVHVRADVLRTLIDRGFVPVVASIAMDEHGQAYNVNADVVASELAVALGAEKLVYINDVPGLIGPGGELISELSAAQCLDVLGREGVVEGGMIPKLESAVNALKAGIGRVHLVDGRVEHALVLELFTPEGVGTMITPDAEPGGVRRDRSAGEAFVMPTYARYPLTLVRGEGLTVWDDEGTAYLDFAGALGAIPLGHGHPAGSERSTSRSRRSIVTSNLFATQPQAELAGRLAELLPIPDARVFFCNSGAEANEAAIKLVRTHGAASGRPTIVALDGSFHGRTIATLAATGQPAKRRPFEPLVDWFRFVPPNDLAALKAELGAGDVGAVLLEPVLGEGGVRPLTAEYLRGGPARRATRTARCWSPTRCRRAWGGAATGWPSPTPAWCPTW